MIPRNFEARRFDDIHQAEVLARWCGGKVYLDDHDKSFISTPAAETCWPGDWIIRAADGTVRVDPPGTQAGYCADCGEPVWWHDVRLVTRDERRWCYGPGGSRLAMNRWHALPGTHQYIVPAAEGQVCYCLDRSWPHAHTIVPVSEHPLPEGWHHSGATPPGPSSLDTCGECTGGLIAAGVRCNCDPGPEGQHRALCGFIPCPNGCWEKLHPEPAPADPRVPGWSLPLMPPDPHVPLPFPDPDPAGGPS